MPQPFTPPPMMAMSYIRLPRRSRRPRRPPGASLEFVFCQETKIVELFRKIKPRRAISICTSLSRQMSLQARRRRRIGHEIVELRDVADAHRGGPFELHAVGNQDRLARAVHDRLGDLDLAVVEVEQRAVLVDRRGADDGVIDLELADEIDRGLADDAAVGVPHDAARDDDLDRRRIPARYSQH